MADELTICNQALGWLGANRITSLTDDSNEAKLCAENYPHIRDAVMEDRAWTFADASFILESPIEGGWGRTGEHLYLLPPAVIRVYRVYKRVDLTQPVQLEGWRREGKYVAAKYAQRIYVRATVRNEDVSSWTPAFGQAVAARLAADLAIAITRSRQLQADMWNVYELKMEAAAATDAGQARSERTDSTELVAARYADGLSRAGLGR